MKLQFISVCLGITFLTSAAGAQETSTSLPIGIAAHTTLNIPDSTERAPFAKREISCVTENNSDHENFTRIVGEKIVLPDDLAKFAQARSLMLKSGRLWIDAETIVIQRPVVVGSTAGLLLTSQSLHFVGAGEIQIDRFKTPELPIPPLSPRCQALIDLTGVSIFVESLEVTESRPEVLAGNGRYALQASIIRSARQQIDAKDLVAEVSFAGDRGPLIETPSKTFGGRIANDVIWPDVVIAKLRSLMLDAPYDETVRQRVAEVVDQLLASEQPFRGTITADALELRSLAQKGMNLHGQDAYFLPLTSLGELRSHLASILKELPQELENVDNRLRRLTSSMSQVHVEQESARRRADQASRDIGRYRRAIEENSRKIDALGEQFLEQQEAVSEKTATLAKKARDLQQEVERRERKARRRAKRANTLNMAATAIGGIATGGAGAVFAQALNVGAAAASAYATAKNASQLCGEKLESLDILGSAIGQYDSNMASADALQLRERERSVRHNLKSAECYLAHDELGGKDGAATCLRAVAPSLRTSEYAEPSEAEIASYDIQFRAKKSAALVTAAGNLIKDLASLSIEKIDIPKCDLAGRLAPQLEAPTRALLDAKQLSAETFSQIEGVQQELESSLSKLANSVDEVHISTHASSGLSLNVDSLRFLIDDQKRQKRDIVLRAANVLEGYSRWSVLQDKFRGEEFRSRSARNAYLLQHLLLRQLVDIDGVKIVLRGEDATNSSTALDYDIELIRSQADGLLHEIQSFPSTPRALGSDRLPVPTLTLGSEELSRALEEVGGSGRVFLPIGNIIVPNDRSTSMSIRSLSIGTNPFSGNPGEVEVGVKIEPWGVVSDGKGPPISYCLGAWVLNGLDSQTCGEKSPNARPQGSFSLGDFILSAAGVRPEQHTPSELMQTVPPWGKLWVDIKSVSGDPNGDLEIHATLKPSD